MGGLFHGNGTINEFEEQGSLYQGCPAMARELISNLSMKKLISELYMHAWSTHTRTVAIMYRIYVNRTDYHVCCFQVGACIVNEDQIIVGMGYNSMPYLDSHVTSSAGEGVTQNDEKFPWDKGEGWKEEKEISETTKYAYGNYFSLCMHERLRLLRIHVHVYHTGD